MKALLRRPATWLWLQFALSFLYFQLLGKLRLVEYADGATYRLAAEGSWSQLLSAKVTFLYPLLLRGLGGLDPGLSSLPFIHYLLHLGAIAFFYVALQRFGVSPWVALGAASALLYGPLPHYWTGVLGTDSLAGSLALATVSCLLLASRYPGRPLLWIGVASSLFLTYQARPAYLFQLALVPLLGVVLAALRNPLLNRRALLAVAVPLAAVALLPYLAFCTLRLAAVGHFGLVSFGGYNLVGIVGQTVDAGTLPRLHGDDRLLVEAYLARRGDAGPRRLRGSFYERELRYVETVMAYEQAARGLYGDDVPRINRALGGLSARLLRQRPEVYAYWLIQGFQVGISRLAAHAVGTRALTLIAFALVLAHGGWLLLAGRGRAGQADGDSRVACTDLATLFWLAVPFALAKLALVILVEQPHQRYMHAAALLLPALLGGALADRLLRLLPLLARRPAR